MKKMARTSVENNTIFVLDSKNYIIIEEDGQHISDKYVDWNGRKINTYKILGKGNLIIRRLYCIMFEDGYYSIKFKKFRNYVLYNPNVANKINSSLNTKNSLFDDEDIDDFRYVQDMIMDMFLERMEIEIR